MTHSCIKCGSQYHDEEPEAYYCDKCLAEKRAIAAQVDAKMSRISRRETMTPLQEYDAATKVRGFMQVRL